MNGRRGEIGDLEAYLLGSFYHRLRRALKKEQRREETIHLVSSIEELEVLGKASHAEQHDIEGTLHAQEILDRMDDVEPQSLGCARVRLYLEAHWPRSGNSWR